MLTALTGYNNVISTTLRLTGAARLVEIVSISDYVYVMRSYNRLNTIILMQLIKY